MNLETFELAKRAVACKNWKWMPGMRILPHKGLGASRICSETSVVVESTGAWYHLIYLNDLGMLDLSDPATVGCLFDLVRKAWHAAPANVNCHMSYSPEKGHYRYWTCSYCTGEKWEQTQGETEAEALVLALEASNV